MPENPSSRNRVLPELGRTSPAFRSAFGANVGIGAQGLVMFGSAEQKARWLPGVASGQIVTSFALTEPEAGSDGAAVRTTAILDGDAYVLNGSKRYITNANKAGLFTVTARTATDVKGAAGVSAFLVPRDLAGVSTGKPEKKMGQQGAHISDVNFDNVRVPVENRLGDEGQGFKIAMQVLDRGRLHISALCVGVAERLLADCVAYGSERKQFGQRAFVLFSSRLFNERLSKMCRQRAVWGAVGFTTGAPRPNVAIIGGRDGSPAGTRGQDAMTASFSFSDAKIPTRPGLWASVAVAALLASPALATPLEAGAKVETVAASAPVDFEVLLPLRNQVEMETLLRAQQARGSSQYHKWLTPAEFAARFGPTAAAMNSAKSAAQAAGMTVSATHSRSFHVKGDAAHANGFLHTSLKIVTAPDGRTRMIAATRPTLSTELSNTGAKVIAFNAVHARQPFASKGPEATPENRNGSVGAYWFDDDKQAYSYPAYKTTVDGQTAVTDGTGVSVAILMEDKLFNGDLLAAFEHESFGKIAHAPIPTVTTVDVAGGGVVGGNGTFEASLDVQQVTGGAPGSKVTLVSLPDLEDGDVFDGYVYIVESNKYDIVNSSFGECELEYTAPYNGGVDFTDILMSEHEIFAQGNIEGITFVASSGDNGGVMCPTPNYAPGVNATFVAGVSTPADDPDVTAVGGGNLITSDGPGLNSTYVTERAYGDPEVPYDIYGLGANVSGGYWGAGGGVSAIFAKPAYQTLVSSGSATARTVPDVGMQVGGLGFSSKGTYCQSPARRCAINDSSVLTAYGVRYGGGFYYTIGTSVSSPEFVGALALYEQRAGRQGNVNPYLYAEGAAQTYAGGVNAPPQKQYFHRGQTGFDGAYPAGYPSANYDYIYGNGSPNVVNLFGLNAYGLAGTPQTPSNP